MQSELEDIIYPRQNLTITLYIMKFHIVYFILYIIEREREYIVYYSAVADKKSISFYLQELKKQAHGLKNRRHEHPEETDPWTVLSFWMRRHPVLYRRSLFLGFCVWGLRWSMRMIRKSLPFSYSLQVLVLYNLCTVNAFSYWFSSLVPSFLCLSLFTLAFFCGTLHCPLCYTRVCTEAFLTYCPDLSELKSELDYISGHWLLIEKQENPAHTKQNFHPQSKLVADFFSFSNLCLFINSGQNLI